MKVINLKSIGTKIRLGFISVLIVMGVTVVYESYINI